MKNEKTPIKPEKRKHSVCTFPFFTHTVAVPKVTFRFNGQIRQVEVAEGKTILEAALENDVPMEHACGGNGFCTTCLCNVRAGMENTSPRSEREENMGVLEDPERLGCQAQIRGDVEVEIEEI